MTNSSLKKYPSSQINNQVESMQFDINTIKELLQQNPFNNQIDLIHLIM